MKQANTTANPGASNHAATCYGVYMDVTRRAWVWALCLGAVSTADSANVAAEKRASLAIGAGWIRARSTSADRGGGQASRDELTSLLGVGLGLSLERDTSLRWAWRITGEVGYATGDQARWTGAVDLGVVYRLDILAWVPYARAAVGARAGFMAEGSGSEEISPTGVVGLGLMRLRDRDASWRGELTYRVALDSAQGRTAAHEAMFWLARSWHWDYF